MKRKTYWSGPCVILFAVLAACGGGEITPPPVETITMTSGSAQSATIGSDFAAPLVATVSTGGSPNPGVVVTFTAPAAGASGTFASGGASAAATTDSHGVATSPILRANGTVGGPYLVTASVAGVTTPASFTLTNTATQVTSAQFAFYLSGEEGLGYFYTIAGSVTIASNGDVLGGEQDFNDGFNQGKSTITGGTLTTDAATGQGTLTLIPDPPELGGTGGNGVETIGVQFVNPNHALLIEFDEGATSSGSLDLQTLSVPAPTALACIRGCGGGGGSTPVTLNGNYAFALSGIDSSYAPVVVGGVFSTDGSGSLTGRLDANDGAAGLATNLPFGATITGPDTDGRGTITTSGVDGIVSSLAYYIVGPEAVRIVDMDPLSSAIGSAFGQGSGEFAPDSLSTSVFSVESNEFGNIFVAAGMFITNATDLKPAAHQDGVPPSSFSGVGDENEEGVTLSNGTRILGTYSIGADGYGSLTVTNRGLGDGDIASLGLYMVDPTININDPNSTTGGGGALIADLDESFIGIGVLLPQTDSSAASFQANYAFGMHMLTGCVAYVGCEVDLLGAGSVDDGGVLTGSGLLSDPNLIFVGGGERSDVDFHGNTDRDAPNPGRYTMFAGDSLVAGFGGNTQNFSTVIYQANGGQLLWIENNDDEARVFAGSLQQRAQQAPDATQKAAMPDKLKLKPKL